MLKIAVVEDHQDSLEEMLIFLNSLGWQADGTDCGEGLNELLNKDQYHLVLLDLNLPHEDGLSIAKRLKETHPKMGVIMLTARTLSKDRLMGYKSGADVYLYKPVNLDEIEAVITNLAGRLQVLGSQEGATLNIDKCTLEVGGHPPVKLTQTEARLLRILAQMPAREADVEHMLQELSKKESDAMSRENIQVHMSRIRAKAPSLPDGVNLISSIRGFGYRLNIPLTIQA